MHNRGKLLLKWLGLTAALVCDLRAEATVNAPLATVTPRTHTRGQFDFRIDPRFTGLVMQDGSRVQEALFHGKYRLVVFGFTYCPDACPTVMLGLGKVLKELGPDAVKVRAVFVSVDPRRDTPAALRAYSANFDRRIMLLTGEERTLSRVAGNYGARYSRPTSREAKTGRYMISHTTRVALVSPDGYVVETGELNDNNVVNAITKSIKKL